MMYRHKSGIFSVSKYFTWGEALLLPSWDMYAIPTQGQAREITILALRLDQVREILQVPLRVTSWLRPVIEGRGDYNEFIGGAKNSNHKRGAAVDVVPQGKSIRRCYHEIEPYLGELGLRMERIDKPDGTVRDWLHFDTGCVPEGGKRVFLP